MRRLVAVRRLSQIFFLLVFVYILWSTTYPLVGLLPPGTFFVADPLITLCTSLASRVLLPAVWLSLGMLFLTVAIGRFFCGWVCPLGTCIDAAGALRHSRKRHGFAATLPKYLILAAALLFAFCGMQVIWLPDPTVIAARFVSLNLIPALTAIFNGLFVLLVRDLRLHGPVLDLYRALKPTILGVKVYHFSHAFLIAGVMAGIAALALFTRRFWCRTLCPLGALYALTAYGTPLRRRVERCSSCGRCRSECRMGAIRDDMSYAQGECILCMDCIYECPLHATRFTFGRSLRRTPPVVAASGKEGGISRGQFLLFAAASVCATGFRAEERRPAGAGRVIRPPAALREDAFLDRCVRCGNCMKVCPTNGLQPALFQSGAEGIWTPHLVPEIGYCEYQCTLCGAACPTGAIPPIGMDEKRMTRLGIARLDTDVCIPWRHGKECIVCQEHCPVSSKAIKVERSGGILKPFVDPHLCVGCGICQNKCPVRPVRAIRVEPIGADRT